MWVNFYRLHNPGQSQRTTSPGEALHSSMKNGHDRVYAGCSAQKSTESMVSKTEQRTDAISKFNAKQFQSTPLWTDSDTAGVLTRYCERKADEQWKLRSRYKVFRYSEDRFYVWSPSLEDNRAYSSVVPSFFRVREVQIAKNDKFVGCSCGFSSRHKYPCHHVFAVVGRRHWKMYGVRWMTAYNLWFATTNGDEMTDFFRCREADKLSQDVVAGEQVQVDEELLTDAKGLPFGDLSADCIPLKVKFWTDYGRPIVWGEAIPDIPELFQNELSQQDDGGNNGGFSLCMEFPDELEKMRRADLDFTQESQQKAAKEIEKYPKTKDQELTEMIRGALKYIGRDEEEYSKFCANLNALVHKVRSTFVKKTEMKQRNDPDVSNGKEVRLEMVPTGRSTKKNKKRKKGSHERTRKRKKSR